MTRLLVLVFDPATERSARLRQCLTVFFEVYPPFSGEHQHVIADAYLSAARRSLQLCLKHTQAPLLMRFATQLLQARPLYY